MKKSGKFYLPKNDTYFEKFIKDEKEFMPHAIEHAIKIANPGVALDVGAHVGMYSVKMADKFDVIAIEANKETFECLLENTKHLKNVTCYNNFVGWPAQEFAVSKEDEKRIGNSGANYIEVCDKTNPKAVENINLDNVTADVDVTLIKIDIEGYELSAIYSCISTIKRCHPVLLVEVTQEKLNLTNQLNPTSTITSLGYKLVARCGKDLIFEYKK